MPFHSKALGAALSIFAVVAASMAMPVRAQQVPPAAGQEAAPDAKPQGDAAPAAQAPYPQAPAARLPSPRPPAGPVRSGRARPAAVVSTVNLRSAPGTDAEVITTIPAGSRVRTTGCDGEWCAVTWNGHSGYAIARNLATMAPRQARGYGMRPGYAADGEYVEDYEPAPPYAYEAPGYYAAPPIVYGQAYYGPGYYYGSGLGWRRRW